MKYGFVCAITVALMIGVYSHGASATSATVCDAYARNYATQTSRQGQIVGGAFVGSLIGLGIVAATGGTALLGGALVGAGIGGMAGGTVRNDTANTIYRAAYNDCRAGRIR